MTLQKSELKTALLKDYHDKTVSLGVSADDELLKLEGALGVLQLAVRTLDQNREFYRKKLQDDELTKEQYEHTMLVMDRDRGSLTSLHQTTQVEMQRKQGEIHAFKRVTELLKKEAEREMTAVAAGVERPEATAAVTDIAKRRTKAKKKTAKKKVARRASKMPVARGSDASNA